MSGPTREEAIEWGRQVGLLPDNSHPAPETRSMRMREDRIFALVRTAFAAGSRSGEDARDEWRDALHTFAHDYNRYTEGDAKMPFGTLRVSLAAFLEASAKLDAAMGGPDA